MTKPMYFYVRVWMMRSYKPHKLKRLLRRKYTLLAMRTERRFCQLSRTGGERMGDALLQLIFKATAIANIADSPERGGIPLRRYQRAVHAGLWKTKGIRLRPKLIVVYS